MFFGLMVLDKKRNVLVPFTHNLTKQQMEAAAADIKRRSNAPVSYFTHALFHDGDPATDCRGCLASIQEELDIMQEKEALRERPTAVATTAATPSQSPTGPVERTGVSPLPQGGIEPQEASPTQGETTPQ